MGGCLRWAGPCDAAISEAWSRNKHLATLYFIYTFSNFNIINVSLWVLDLSSFGR